MRRVRHEGPAALRARRPPANRRRHRASGRGAGRRIRRAEASPKDPGLVAAVEAHPGGTMSTRLIDRLRDAPRTPTSSAGGRSPALEKIVYDLHEELVDTLDLQLVRRTPRDELERRLRRSLGKKLEERSTVLSDSDRATAVQDVIDEVLGLGPIERLMREPGVTDILINGAENIFIERGGRLVKVDVRFRDERHLLRIIDRIVSAVGRRVDESHPLVDARMADGSRFNAIIPPLALDGPLVSIRRFGANPIEAEDLVRLGSVPAEVLELLKSCVAAKLNIVVSGGTGSGKTTLLNVLSSYVPAGERLITIEDAAELRLQQDHVARLETRPPNLEGEGEVTARDLVRNALRMRPDRIIVGEIRGAEAIDMLQAMNTGHEGSLGTIHANGTRDAISRMETMVGLGFANLSEVTTRQSIARALDLVIQLDRLSDGTRRIVAVSEVSGMEGDIITMQDIFVFEQRTVDGDGRVRGTFRATGVRPMFAKKLEAYGLPIPARLLRLSEDV
ncbi:MAG: CpaF family protein [Deltaproteobacteria bacterium]|nr:CpaF family protein [Deltaproteobacteria bacterium]